MGTVPGAMGTPVDPAWGGLTAGVPKEEGTACHKVRTQSHEDKCKVGDAAQDIAHLTMVGEC